MREASVPSRLLGCLIRSIWILCQALLIAWGALVVYFSNLPWPAGRLTLAICFALGSGWLVGLSRRRRAFAVFVLLLAGIVAWWVSILPSHHRMWRPEVAVMARAVVDGDTVRITGVRDFDYR